MPPPNTAASSTPTQPTTNATIATTTQSSPDLQSRNLLPTSLILRLRAPSATAGSRRIRWAEDVIDNEGLGRKKSKVCCIYHAPREPGDSSSDSSSDSDSDSDSDLGSANDDGRARRVGAAHSKKKQCKDQDGNDHKHEHGDGEDACHADGAASSGRQTRAHRPRRKGQNAYEKVPKRRDAR